MSHNLYEILARRWAGARTAPCLRVPGGPSYNPGQLDHRSGAMAEVLRQAGATPGDRVAAQVDKTPDAVALYLACLRGGFIYVPLDPSCGADHLGFVLGDVEPAVFVCKKGLASRLSPVAALAGARTTLTLSASGTGTLADAASAAIAQASTLDRMPDDIACVAYTAGTTGRPKGAMLTHGAIATNARSIQSAWRFQPDDVLLHTTPIADIHGWTTALHSALPAGAQVLLPQKRDPAMIRHLLGAATVVSAPPLLYARLLADTDIGPGECRAIRILASGSGALPRAVSTEFTRRTGRTIVDQYILTEFGVVASYTADVDDPAIIIGQTLPGIAVRVADENNQPVEPGQTGEIQLRGDQKFRGYWRRDDQTIDALTADGYFRTGDLGSMLADGQLMLIGRLSDTASISD